MLRAIISRISDYFVRLEAKPDGRLLETLETFFECLRVFLTKFCGMLLHKSFSKRVQPLAFFIALTLRVRVHWNVIGHIEAQPIPLGNIS